MRDKEKHRKIGGILFTCVIIIGLAIFLFISNNKKNTLDSNAIENNNGVIELVDDKIDNNEQNIIEEKGEESATKEVKQEVSNTPKSEEKEKIVINQKKSNTNSKKNSSKSTNYSKSTTNNTNQEKSSNITDEQTTTKKENTSTSNATISDKKDTAQNKDSAKEKAVEKVYKTPSKNDVKDDPEFIKLQRELYSSMKECESAGEQAWRNDPDNVSHSFCKSENYKGVEAGIRLYIVYEDGTMKKRNK